MRSLPPDRQPRRLYSSLLLSVRTVRYVAKAVLRCLFVVYPEPFAVVDTYLVGPPLIGLSDSYLVLLATEYVVDHVLFGLRSYRVVGYRRAVLDRLNVTFVVESNAFDILRPHVFGVFLHANNLGASCTSSFSQVYIRGETVSTVGNDDGYPDEDLHRRHSDEFREFSMPLVDEISVWSPTSVFDRVIVSAYSFVEDGAGLVFALGTVLVAAVLVAVFLVGVAIDPLVGVFTVLSVVPAFFLAWYFREADPTPAEPPVALVVTFLFGGISVGAALLVNTVTRPFLTSVPVVGSLLFFYMVVAPVEEGVKLLAVRLYAYRQDYFTTAVQGAVYGAFAGLGFAAFENLLYLATDTGVGYATSVGRAAVAPGHVLWSAIAGYYLGLGKANPNYEGAIALKGLVVAGLFHATYNAVIRYGAAAGVGFETTGPRGVGLFVFLTVLYAFTAYYLVSKVERHRDLYASLLP